MWKHETISSLNVLVLFYPVCVYIYIFIYIYIIYYIYYILYITYILYIIYIYVYKFTKQCNPILEGRYPCPWPGNFLVPLLTSKPATITQSAHITTPPNQQKVPGLTHSKIKWLAKYTYIQIYQEIVRLSHRRSGDSQGNETFWAPSLDKQTATMTQGGKCTYLPTTIRYWNWAVAR